MKKISTFSAIIFATCCASWCQPACAAHPSDSADTLWSVAPKIYIDCPDIESEKCDIEYFRTELGFVNFVRDRQEADIHILITARTTGGGGTQYSLEFNGFNHFAGKKDTLIYSCKDSDSEDAIRGALLRTLKLGLASYIGRTPLAPFLNVQYSRPSRPEAAVDKWNYWVFSISIDGWVQGTKSFREFYDYITLAAKRTTEQNKILFSAWSNYHENKYTMPDYRALSISRGWGSDIEYIKSLGGKWSVGLYQSIFSSTYDNRDLGGSTLALAEYDIFPYSESTRRLLTLRYRVGLQYLDYHEPTIYDKNWQWLTSELFAVTADLKRPWGSIYTVLSGSHYFYDFRRNYLQLYTRLSLQVVKGLSFNITASGARVHNQIYLPKGDLSQEDIILQRKDMETSYNYWVNFGVSYSFGSIYNNIVNPRLEN
ncbi:conserved exported hypothetical protein [Candidatus Zixiibacteriota bacterium]|nr:conserved exported hypothetical protein [candidate division Zixibacteria bacterium]